jgi:hypothetical protein
MFSLFILDLPKIFASKFEEQWHIKQLLVIEMRNESDKYLHYNNTVQNVTLSEFNMPLECIPQYLLFQRKCPRISATIKLPIWHALKNVKQVIIKVKKKKIFLSIYQFA